MPTLDDKQQDFVVVSEAIQRGAFPAEKPSTANYRRAFYALAFVIASEWTTSDQLSRYVNVVRAVAGDEPADFLTRLFNATRSRFMQDMMG